MLPAKSKGLRFLLVLLFCSIALYVCAQSADTVYYNNKRVLMITVNINHRDSVLGLYDLEGQNILVNDSSHYSFFDQKFNKKRTIKVIDRMLYEDYCISEADTVYNYFQHDEAFDVKIKQFYNYLEQHVVYPKNALKKGVQAQVKISFIIDHKGTITKIVPLSKHEWGFEESLISALNDKKQFGFVIFNKRPVKYYIEIPFAFVIKKK